MFTVKFYRKAGEHEFGDGNLASSVKGSLMHSFQVPHYSAHERPCGRVTITLYKDLYDLEGVERHVSERDKDYDSCYVENSAGKTVATWRAQKSPDSLVAGCGIKS